eukprot:TRINITY_DN9787_c0_g1_i2.p1 TRINITY_DN9787_c0_g1~~TRINITY_DN9787_c0_g1_i2.p1  ORF type:complete len:874 (+),score=183.67 TRINITY_DN9787_c0_g1_i2:1860-4481(+)
MVHALCRLSSEMVTSSQSVSPSSRGVFSSFAIQRLADIAVVNVLRLQVFWDLLQEHFEWLVKESDNEAIRKASVDAASQTILSYLQKYRQPVVSPPLSPAVPLAPNGNRQRSTSTLERPSWLDESPSDQFWEMQPKVIAVLRAMRSSGKPDVAVGCLNLIFTVMQRAGQELVPASWRLILSILSSSSQTGAEVPIGFKSVVLVCSDFMPILDHDGLQALIACVGQFSQQTAIPDKTNTNLSAIQQTLSIADFCSSHPSHASPTHWNSLFVQLRDAASDARPEVRHSAMKTLFTALVTHGNGLPSPCWNTLFWDVLLKVLDNVHSAALAAEQQGLNQELQSQKGLIMHHSRNTAAKQWYETRCTVLDGVSRLIRVFYPVISTCVTRFSEVLNRMAVHLANASLHSTEEVATVGLKSLQFLLVDISNTAKEEHAVMLWEVAWSTWERIADTSGDGSPLITVVMSTLAEGLADLCGMAYQQNNIRLREYMEKQGDKVLALLEKLMKSKAAYDTVAFPSKLQQSVLKCIKVQPVPTNDIILKTRLVALLCSFLPSSDLLRSCSADPESIPKLLVHGEAQMCERVLGILRDVFCSTDLQDDVKRNTFDTIVRAVGSILLTRHFMPRKYEMWKIAVEVMPSIFQAALDTFKTEDLATEAMWQKIVAMLKGYLLIDAVQAAPPSQAYAEHPQQDHAEGCDMEVLSFVNTVLLPCTVRHKVANVQQEIIESICWCSRQQTKRLLSETAMQIMFGMCEADGDVGIQIGRAAMPVVALRCKEILKLYLTDYKSQGRCPLPQHRHDEVLSVFGRLARSEFPPVLFDTMRDPPSLRTTCPAAYGPRGLSVRLFPVLTEFVTCHDEELTEALRTVLRLVSSELGLA